MPLLFKRCYDFDFARDKDKIRSLPRYIFLSLIMLYHRSPICNLLWIHEMVKDSSYRIVFLLLSIYPSFRIFLFPTLICSLFALLSVSFRLLCFLSDFLNDIELDIVVGFLCYGLGHVDIRVETLKWCVLVLLYFYFDSWCCFCSMFFVKLFLVALWYSLGMKSNKNFKKFKLKVFFFIKLHF